MTRQQSKLETIQKIRKAKSGKEISEAICSHFKKYVETPEEVSTEYLINKYF